MGYYSAIKKNAKIQMNIKYIMVNERDKTQKAL